MEIMQTHKGKHKTKGTFVLLYCILEFGSYFDMNFDFFPNPHNSYTGVFFISFTPYRYNYISSRSLLGLWVVPNIWEYPSTEWSWLELRVIVLFISIWEPSTTTSSWLSLSLTHCFFSISLSLSLSLSLSHSLSLYKVTIPR